MMSGPVADPSQVRAIAGEARAAYAHRLEVEDAGDSENLQAECIPASLEVRDALRGAGLVAQVRLGYFAVEYPDGETCLCGGRSGAHIAACYYEPHAWVEVADLLVDITAAQFDDELRLDQRTPPELSPVEVRPLREAYAGRWLLRLPAGITSPDKTWAAGSTLP